VPVVLQNRQRVVAINWAWLRRTAEAVLSAARADGAELSLVLVSDRRMRALNRRYRKKDRPTDVLAFPLQISPLTPTLSLQGRGGKNVSSPPSGERTKVRGRVEASSQPQKPPMLWGDVVISVPTARRQATELGHGLREELRRLLVHGVLHLLGYDHEQGPRDAALMARKERAILKAIGGDHPHPFPPGRPLLPRLQRAMRGRVWVGGQEKSWEC
jgi:rRNA maturation RNase YbeY